jgi:hypothetical protein
MEIAVLISFIMPYPKETLPETLRHDADRLYTTCGYEDMTFMLTLTYTLPPYLPHRPSGVPCRNL